RAAREARRKAGVRHLLDQPARERGRARGLLEGPSRVSARSRAAGVGGARRQPRNPAPAAPAWDGRPLHRRLGATADVKEGVGAKLPSAAAPRSLPTFPTRSRPSTV